MVILCFYIYTCHDTEHPLLHLKIVVLIEENNASCQDGEVRLANGLTLYEGRVEICFNSTWGAVCSSQTGTSSFGVEEAAVVCRQVGLIPNGKGFSCISNY